MPDVEALRKLRAEGVPALLYGPPGTGKTSLVEAAFPGLITVAGDGETTVGDFVGEYIQKPGGGYEFIYGPLVRAMTEGRVLFIDDATLISLAVLAVCYPAMDGRREVIVKAHQGETITAVGGFCVVAGHNPGVHGAVLTEALSSRFTFQFSVSTDYDQARSLGIDGAHLSDLVGGLMHSGGMPLYALVNGQRERVSKDGPHHAQCPECRWGMIACRGTKVPPYWRHEPANPVNIHSLYAS